MSNFDFELDLLTAVRRNCDVPFNNLIDAARLSYARLGTQLERKPVCERVSPWQLRAGHLSNEAWGNMNVMSLMRFMHWDYRTRACYTWEWNGWQDTDETQTSRFWGMIRLIGDALNANETTADVYGPVEPTFVPFDETNPEHNLADTQMNQLEELVEYYDDWD